MSLVRKHAAAGLDEAARLSRRRRMTAGALDETGMHVLSVDDIPRRGANGSAGASL
jgi:hypothetical protein